MLIALRSLLSYTSAHLIIFWMINNWDGQALDNYSNNLDHFIYTYSTTPRVNGSYPKQNKPIQNFSWRSVTSWPKLYKTTCDGKFDSGLAPAAKNCDFFTFLVAMCKQLNWTVDLPLVWLHKYLSGLVFEVASMVSFLYIVRCLRPSLMSFM